MTSNKQETYFSIFVSVVLLLKVLLNHIIQD
jgi:hypothetical protein